MCDVNPDSQPTTTEPATQPSPSSSIQEETTILEPLIDLNWEPYKKWTEEDHAKGEPLTITDKPAKITYTIGGDILLSPDPGPLPQTQDHTYTPRGVGGDTKWEESPWPDLVSVNEVRSTEHIRPETTVPSLDVLRWMWQMAR